MARKKLSEFTAKTLLFHRLDLPYSGVPVTLDDVKDLSKELSPDVTYVVKVDEGVKGRMKKGLVALKVKTAEIPEKVQELAQKGYSRFLIEEFVPHESGSECYFSIERNREGNVVYYSNIGGIDIEQNQDKVKKQVLTDKNKSEIAKFLGLPEDIFAKITEFFDAQYVSFLEVNPLVVEKGKYYFLDLAVEVDSAAEFFVQNGWVPSDFVGEIAGTTEEEQNIINLKAKSQAAFKFDLLNPDGSIWMLLSGGGASIVLADEVYNLGKGKDLANYGEYSGNPNQEETYIYTRNLLNLLLKSKAPKKVLIIGGGVANFTDIRSTFKGVVRALEEVKDQLGKQCVQVFVRRGGPNQQAGLAAMKKFLQQAGILGGVWDPTLVITDIVEKAIDYLTL